MNEWILRDSRRPELVQHPSTEAALTAMRGLSLCPKRVLDVGCGSGLLSFAATALWPGCTVVACDISAQAVADTQANIDAHDLSAHIRVYRSDGLSHPEIQASAPYDLIVCNLLAETLVAHARTILNALMPEGMAVLSGILAWRLPQVIQTYQALGAPLVEEISVQQWRAVVVGNKPA